MSLTRRDLFKGAGIAAASVAAAGALGGCAQKASASDDWMPSTWDYETDVLVIGYGGAGMWASLIGADGIHPTQAGHDLIHQSVQTALSY